MAEVFMVSYRLGGGRRKHVAVAANSEDEARRHVCELESLDQMDNNLFLNLDGIEVKLMN